MEVIKKALKVVRKFTVALERCRQRLGTSKEEKGFSD